MQKNRQPLPIETLTAKIRREAEMKGQVGSSQGLTQKPPEYIRDYSKFAEDLYTETTRRFGPSAHDTAKRSYKENRFDFVSDASWFQPESYPGPKQAQLKQEKMPDIGDVPVDVPPTKHVPDIGDVPIDAVPSVTKAGQASSPGFDDEEAFKFVSKSEGYRDTVYGDIKGIKTIGYGTNLESPIQRGFVKQALGYDDKQVRELMSGTRKLNKKQARAVFELSMDEAEKVVDAKLKGVNLRGHQRIALVSLAYNNPSLVGPNLIAFLQKGDTAGAINEVLYNSNRERSKGLAYRRYDEALQLAGRANHTLLPDIEEYMQEYI